jgi:hypothetical protein
MIIWAIWKERNRCIFRNQSWPEGKIKETIISMTRETVQSHNCQIGRVQLTDHDSQILEAFHLKDGRNPNQVSRSPQLQVGERNWKPPLVGSLKLNFDGTSKGNPGRIGMGGVIRDSKENIIQLYTGSLGNSTNNVMEFEDRSRDSKLGRDDKCHSGRRFHDGYQHSKENPKWYQSGQNSETLALGTFPAKNS